MPEENESFVVENRLSDYKEWREGFSKFPNLLILGNSYYETFLKDKTDYISKAIKEKFFGSEICHFIKSYNHRHHQDIKSISGLEDYLFNDGSSSTKDQFFLDPIKYHFNRDANFASKTAYRSKETSLKFDPDNKNHNYDDLTDLKEFSIYIPITFTIIDNDSNHCCSKLLKFLNGDSVSFNIGIYLERTICGDNRDITYDNIRIIGYQKNSGWRRDNLVFTRYFYNNDQQRLCHKEFSVPTDSYCKDGYNDIHYKYDRGCYILCDKPLFSQKQVEFFSWLEKMSVIYQATNLYSEKFSMLNVESTWIHQLIYKILFYSDNAIIKTINSCVKNSNEYHHLSYIPCDDENPRRNYDEYSSSMNMIIDDKFPKYLDLENHCYLQLYQDIINNEPMINESYQQFMRRKNDSSIKSIKEILDECNLMRNQHFIYLVNRFNNNQNSN